MVSVLLDNALKHSPAGGSIRLAARHSGKWVEITVSNTVDAVQDTDTARLFDRFYRADESHSGTVSGTGIGLSILLYVVRQKIHIFSQNFSAFSIGYTSFSVPPWNLKVIRPSAYTVTVSITVSQSFSSNSESVSNFCTSNMNAPTNRVLRVLMVSSC